MSDQTIEAVVDRVEAKTINRKSDNQPMTLYEVTAQGVKWTTGRGETAQAAHSLIGRLAILNVKVEQNGIYENRYLQGIAPSPNLTPVQNAAQTAQQAAPPTWPPAAAPTASSLHAGATEAPTGAWGSQPEPAKPDYEVTKVGSSERDRMIFRQVATKVAAHTASNPAEFWENVDKLILFYETGQKPIDSEIPF